MFFMITDIPDRELSTGFLKTFFITTDIPVTGFRYRGFMIYYFDVHYDGRLMVPNVRAYSEEDAIEQVYRKTGSASAYTGRSRRLYKAKRK